MASSTKTRREDMRRSRRNTMHRGLLIACIGCLCQPLVVSGFCPRSIPRPKATTVFSASDPESDISRKVARAKELLEKSKAKLAAKEQQQQKEQVKEQSHDEGATPFFASTEQQHDENNDTEKRNKVIKSKNDETGLITTDGDLMAKMSEEEAWEARPLSDVFENEIEETTDKVTTAIMERDIAASIRSMKTEMEMADYKKIFDSKNRFIGEDN